MPTIHDCERCDKECPQRQLAHQHAVARMHATNEFVNLQKLIDAGELVETVHAYWHWWRNTGEVKCSACNATIGVCYAETAYEELTSGENYCYSCGSRMDMPREKNESIQRVDSETKE